MNSRVHKMGGGDICLSELQSAVFNKLRQYSPKAFFVDIS